MVPLGEIEVSVEFTFMIHVGELLVGITELTKIQQAWRGPQTRE